MISNPSGLDVDVLRRNTEVVTVLLRVAPFCRGISSNLMNTEIARRHVVSILEGYLDEKTADRLIADDAFVTAEIEKVFSAIAQVANGKGKTIGAADREIGLIQHAEDFVARLKEEYPDSFSYM